MFGLLLGRLEIRRQSRATLVPDFHLGRNFLSKRFLGVKVTAFIDNRDKKGIA